MIIYNNGISKNNKLVRPYKTRTIQIQNKKLGESRRTYKASDQIKFKTSTISLNLCNYSDAYILISGTIANDGLGANYAAKQADERNKRVTFKSCAPFTECISKINNTQIDNAKDIKVVMPMYNLKEYSDNYSKISGSLWIRLQ